jgi:putative redox protein
MSSELTAEEKIYFANSDGDTLCGVLHHPRQANTQGAVIVCHGMESDKGSEKLVFLCTELARHGILALRFDFRYVGESSGRYAEITYSGEVEDLRAAYNLMRSRTLGQIAILGSSMGGTVALLFAAREPRLAALAALAAPLHPENFPRRALTPTGLREWREHGFTLHNGRRLNVTLLEDLDKIDVPAAARKITCPVLILHGDADEVVPVAEAYELYDCLTGSKRLSVLEGADHRLSNHAAMRQAMTEALDWLTKHVR